MKGGKFTTTATDKSLIVGSGRSRQAGARTPALWSELWINQEVLLNDSNMFYMYCLNGVPLRRHKARYPFEEYAGRGDWKRFPDTNYAKRAAVPMTPEDHAGLVEAHDLALAQQQYDEQQWRGDWYADERAIRDACAGLDLSRGEFDRAACIARQLCNIARREITARDRLRPRTAMAAVRATSALMERWLCRPDVAGFDRFLPPHEAEDRRGRIHVSVRLAPDVRFVSRSPEGAAIALLAEGIDQVRRFLHRPYMKAIVEFQRRWMPVPPDSSEARGERWSPERSASAVDTWNALSAVEERCFIGFLKAIGADIERFTVSLGLSGRAK